MLVRQINQTLQHRQLQIQLTEDAKRWVVEQTCTHRSYGARFAEPCRNLSKTRSPRALIEGCLTGAALIEIYPDNNSLGIRPLAEEGLGDLENMTGGEGSNDESFKAGEMALR